MFNIDIILKSLNEVGLTLLFIFLGILILEVVLYVVLEKIFKYRFALAFMLLSPAIIGLGALVVYPILWELNLSFMNMSLRHFKDAVYLVGINGRNLFSNYIDVFSGPVLKDATFVTLLGQTVLWTAINVFFHVTIGMGLALLLNRKMRGKGIYRTILVIPWAIPQVIACLAWRGEFSFDYGFVNILLRSLGIAPVQWLTEGWSNFAAMCITNIWLGVPFMMVILLGGLQSIAGEYYEAAEMDGANAWQQFWMVTVPLMRPVITPAIILGTVWTFNNFNVPFLINQNNLESSDILVTALFRAAFNYNQYSFAAAFAFVNFFLLTIFSVFYLKVSGGLKGVNE